MTGSLYDALSISDREAIEELCDEFELRWQQGEPPDLEAFAARLRPSQAVPGLVELIILDSHYQRSAEATQRNVGANIETPVDASDRSLAPKTFSNATARWNDYVKRFPVLRQTIAPREWLEASTAPRALDDRFVSLEPHASGGLGEISLATDQQIGRRVAIKELQARYAQNSEMQQRFVREARLTGQLEHPSIVPIYAAGQRPDGRPFYAMRMIPGKSLLEATRQLHGLADRSAFELRLRELLNRFVDICQAVEYAHSEGILHRDIKPANIMLGSYGESFLVDWGLAKRINEPDPPGTLAATGNEPEVEATREGAVLGTPGYMSPEQTNGTCPLDPRSDVYSLGATLQVLVTGKTPSPPDLNSGDPASAGSITTARGKSISAPLKAIVAKSLSIEPRDRYDSAQALAEDLQRYLADAPISARRDSWLTRCRRWTQSHPGIAGALAASMILALIGLGLHSLWSKQINRILTAQKHELTETLKRESEALHRSEISRRRREIAFDFLAETLAHADPNEYGANVTIEQTLGWALSHLNEYAADDPTFRALILTKIGEAFFGLNQLERSRTIADQTLELLESRDETDELEIDALTLKHKVLRRLGREDPREVAEVAIAKARSLYGSEDIEMLRVRRALLNTDVDFGDPSTAIAELQLLINRFEQFAPDQTAEVVATQQILAKAHFRVAEYQQAVTLAQQVYEHRVAGLGFDSLATLAAGNNFARYQMDLGWLDKAEPLYRELLEHSRDYLGDTHHQTLVLERALGDCLVKQSKWREAIPLLEQNYLASNELFGAENARTISAGNSLANALMFTGQNDAAIAIYEDVYRAASQHHGASHSETLLISTNIANLLRLTGQYERAAERLRDNLQKQRELLGEGHRTTILSIIQLAATLQESGNFVDAQAYCLEAARITSEHFQTGNPLALSALSLLGTNYLGLEQYDQAKQTLRQCLDLRTQFMSEHWLCHYSMSNLGEAYRQAGDLDQAEPLLKEGFEQMLQQRDKIPARATFRLQAAGERLRQLYESQERVEDAAAITSLLNEIQ